MRYFGLLLLPLASAALAGDDADRGPGIAPTRQGGTLVYAARDFTTVGLGLGAQVEVRTGGDYAVTATGPAAAFANVRVERRDQAIDIGHRYRSGHGNDALERQIRFRITMPAIETAAVGGTGDIAIDRVAGDKFMAAIGGAGSVRVARMAVGAAHVAIGGAGNFTGAGTARKLEVDIGGSGSMLAPGLVAQSARVASAGSGNVRTTVTGAATVSLVGGGAVDLGPRARCTVTKMGGGQVRCGN